MQLSNVLTEEGERMSIGDIRVIRKFPYGKWAVLVEKRRNYEREAEFENFEHAVMLSETLKAIHDANVSGDEE